MGTIKKLNMYTKLDISDSQIKYLKATDSKMESLINRFGDITSYRIEDYFTSLVSQIVFQSISYRAADTIWKRLINIVGEFTPKKMLELSDEDIKSAGLSNSKVQYIKNIASAFYNNEINLKFEDMTDLEVKNELQKIKGIGPWTSEMFLIFCLYRKDVFSFGDIAIKNGIKWLYGIDHDLSKKEFGYYKEMFSPYGTIASFYLWEITLRKLLKE